jgi:adenine-specific DNA-methyltransferase
MGETGCTVERLAAMRGPLRKSARHLACRFIATNDDGESFFIRHAYFIGADEPCGKLKGALRAETNEAAWATLYSTVSRPFDPPTTGKIAVKAINHYGDEVLKVYQVGGGEAMRLQRAQTDAVIGP